VDYLRSWFRDGRVVVDGGVDVEVEVEVGFSLISDR
jgi:hypothetical protein